MVVVTSSHSQSHKPCLFLQFIFLKGLLHHFSILFSLSPAQYHCQHNVKTSVCFVEKIKLKSPTRWHKKNWDSWWHGKPENTLPKAKNKQNQKKQWGALLPFTSLSELCTLQNNLLQIKWSSGTRIAVMASTQLQYWYVGLALIKERSSTLFFFAPKEKLIFVLLLDKVLNPSFWWQMSVIC